MASSADLIVAVSTPPGHARRAVIRLSGIGAISALSQRCEGASIETRRHIGRVRLRVDLAFGPISLPAIALVMPAPGTFTLDETVELLVVSSPPVLEGVMAALCDSTRGLAFARRATAGEFSARAYLNGRLSLDEAESTAAAIAAESDAQLAAARRVRSGSAARAGDAVAQEITRVLALVEAGIDFTDQEDVVAITAADLLRVTERLDATIAEVTARVVPAEALRSLPTIALRGAPNAGKSSLFNALLGRERAVESALAGSTRDAIVEPVLLGQGVEALLVDLPGIEDPHGALEGQMQDLAHASLRDAAIQLHCVPAGEPCAEPREGRQMLVRTKCDSVTAEGVGPGLATSARTGHGLDALRGEITARLMRLGTHGPTHAGVLAERQVSALSDARRSLARVGALARDAMARGQRAPEPVECVADELRGALDALAIVAGHRTPDDILAELFARFCVGK